MKIRIVVFLAFIGGAFTMFVPGTYAQNAVPSVVDGVRCWNQPALETCITCLQVKDPSRGGYSEKDAVRLCNATWNKLDTKDVADDKGCLQQKTKEICYRCLQIPHPKRAALSEKEAIPVCNASWHGDKPKTVTRPSTQRQSSIPGCSDGPRPGCCARSIGQPHLRHGGPTTAAEANGWCNRPL